MEYRERYEGWLNDPYFDEATKEELKRLQQQQLEYIPKYETIVLEVENWIQNEETQNYEYTVLKYTGNWPPPAATTSRNI